MSFTDDYLANRKKKKKEEKKTVSGGNSFTKEYLSEKDDIAPVASTPQLLLPVRTGVAPTANTFTAPVRTTTKDDTNKWFKSGAFDDGYQFGDVTKTILGTAGDAAVGVVKGIGYMGEGVADLISYGGAAVQDALGNHVTADAIRERTAKSATDILLGGLEKATDKYSVLGDKSDSVTQGLGQVATILATGGLAGAAGLGTVGATALTTGFMGASSAGSGMGEAYLGGATDEEAATYGLIKGVVDAGSELIFGGLGKAVKAVGLSKGLTSVDDLLAKKLSGKITNQIAKNFAEYGVKASAEGVEEVIAGVGSAMAKQATYMSDKELGELLKDENLMEQFVVGAVTSGIAQSGIVPGMKSGSLAEANKTGRDFITGLSTNEQKVIDKEVENRVAAQEKDGKKLTSKEKNKLYDSVVEDMDKGYISIDTIEEVLGGDTYKSYRETVDSEDALTKEFEELGNKQNATLAEQSRYNELKQQLEEMKQNSQRDTLKTRLSEEVFGLAKDSRLAESYAERSRRGQAFEADLTQYNAKQQEVVRRAAESGILNNTRRTHEFVDLIAKISADKGVLFDFTNNEKLKESGFAVQDKTVNGYVTKDGVTLNIDSAKSLNSVVGHEITHVLEGTELYTALQSAVTEYAKSKGDYQGRYDALAKLYEGVEGANVDAELTADMVGDYLFTDENFIRNLSVNNRNVFQKIYDEIKYLCKVATAGSKEARELEKVKRAFEKAYKEGGKTEGTKYSLSDSDGKKLTKEQAEYFKDSKVRDEDGNLTPVYHGTPTGGFTEFKLPEFMNTLMSAQGAGFYFTDKKNAEQYTKAVNKSVRNGAEKQLYEVYLNITNPLEIKPNERTITKEQFKDILRQGNREWFKTDWMPFFADGVKAENQKLDFETLLDKYTGKVFVQNKSDGDVLAEVTRAFRGGDETILNAMKSVLGHDGVRFTDRYGDIWVAWSANQIKNTSNTNPTEDKDIRYSLSDSDGKKLSKEQQEYFKDSKMRDENGNLKVMYHGSQDAGFHVFDARMSDDDTSFFFVDRNDVAASYSGTTETYEAKTIRTAEDMRNFLQSIGYEGYEVIEEGGKIFIEQDGDYVAGSDTAQGLYEEFCWYEGIGDGDANYKVYLNLKNPLVVDAEGRNWNNVSREFSQEVYDRYQSLTAEEKAALSNLAEWGEYSIFRDEMLEARANAEQGVGGVFDEAYTKTLARAYEKLGGANANLYDAFTIASDNFSEDSLREFAVKQMKTRDYAKRAKAQGYDGVIFNNIVDVGGYGNGDEGAATVAIAFDSNQIKSVANEKPTSNPDIRYSLSEDSEGRKLSPAVQKRFANSKAIDEDGRLKVLYHGTYAGEFSVFDKSKGYVEDDFGSGFYFSDNEADVADHYEGGGPDYENKVARLAERIADEEDIDYDEAEERAREQLHKGSHKFEVYLNIENPAIVGETILFDNESFLEEYNEEDYEDYDDYIADVEQLLADQIENIVWEVERNVDVYSTDGLADIMFYAYGEGGIGLEELKAKIDELYLEDSNGNLVGNEVARQIIESLGYDGIIDPTVSGKWNMNIETGTTHYIVFKPNQIKAVTNENPTDNPDIHRSLSAKGEAPVRRGRYNVFGKDIRLETVAENVQVEEVAPVGAEVARVRDTVQDAPLADPSMYQDEVTPVKWRELAQGVREPEFDGDSWAEDYVRYNSGIRDRVAIAAMQEVIRDSETMSPQQLMAKSAAALAEYEQVQKNKPYGEPYTEAEQILLTTLYSQYSLYDSAARNPAFIEDMKAEIFNEEQDQRERFDSIDDTDAPPEVEAPYQPSQEVKVDDPFEDRDWYEVGNRKVKAYMYENPEVKPFFQEEAAVMLDELNSTTKGERWYDDHVYYDSGGEAGWGGTKRHTSDSIAEMLDGWKMSYDDIEKGLKAIIEDHGAENIAAAKKIEFMLNDRLLNGYTSFVGFEPTMDKWGNVPPNQSYLAMLEEKQVTEYSKEAFEALVADADRYAPVGDVESVPAPAAPAADDIAPVAPTYDVVSDKRGEIKGQQAITKEDAATGKTAKILVEEPEVEKKQSAWSKFKNLVLDKGMVFEDLSIRTGNRELQARWNSIRYARNKAQRLMEKGNASVSSLDSIRKTVEGKGKEYTQKFYDYLYHMHNIDRMSLETEENRVKREGLQVQFQGYTDDQLSDLATSWITKDTPQETTDRIKAAREYVEAKKNGNKPVFGDDVTADISRKTASKLEKANPEFKEYAQEVYGYMNYLREMLVDSGVISNETAKLWAEMYPHYVPISRSGDTGPNINVPLDTGRTGVNAPIKRATGGSSGIRPLFKVMAERTMQTYSAVAKNRFGVELKNTLGTTIGSEAMGLDEAIDSIDTQDGLLQEGKKGKKPTFTVFEDGKRVTFEITEEMYDAMKPTNDTLARTSKVLSAVSDFRRNTLTQYNPWFMLKNAIKDVQDVLINSQHATRTYATIPKAISQLRSNGHWYTEYMENGGEDNSYFDSQSNTFKKPNPTIEAIKKYTGLNVIAKANNIIERLPRLAEYIASREAGRSVDVSMLDAARVTTNFAAGGDVTKFANRNGVTFLNASFQGAMQQVRNVREAKAAGVKGVLNLAAKFAVAGLPALALNALIWGDDEEYEELSDYVKQSYYIVAKTEDGKFIRIPKGRTVAVIQNGFEQMQHLITGDDEADLRTFLDLLYTNLAPNNPLDNNILSPIIDVAQNKTWYGEDLVPTRLQDVPNAEQYDESTDSLSRWLGETFNVSPYKTNYLLDQYGGIISDTFLPMLTPEAESGNDTLAGNLIAPLKDMFTTDSVMNNQNVSDFYDTKDELTKAANSMYATDEDVLKAKYMNSVNSEMGKLYGEKRELQNSDMPDAEKYEAVREVQRQIDELAKSGLDTYNEVLVSGGYATVGDRHYRKKDGEWSKLTDEQLEKQEEVTSGLGISPADYWSDKEEYDFAYEKPEKYAVAKAVGGYASYKDYSDELYDIKADKDENGNSIRNSRKEKVIDWVNNLDADYGTRIILFKNEYNADDTYNYDIIEYLNSREDISYEEMETILKELGFDVDANGNISWD